MRIAEKINRALDEGFSDALAVAFLAQFGIPVETEWNIFAMRKVTTRIDGKDFLPEQHGWIGAFESGYLAAKSIVKEFPCPE